MNPPISVVPAVVVDEVEDRSVAHLAFLNANQMSQPQDLRIPGMQDFAAAVRPQTFQILWLCLKFTMISGIAFFLTKGLLREFPHHTKSTNFSYV